MPPVVPTRRSGRQSAPSSALVSVPYRHGDLLAAGEDYPDEMDRPVPLRPFCERLGIDVATQTRRLRGVPWATQVMMTWVAADGRRRSMAALPLRALPMWLATINPRKVAPGAREVLEAYQCEAADVLRRHFLPRGGPPASPPLPPKADAQALPASPLDRLKARDRAAIEDELFYIRAQAGRLEAQAGLGPVNRHALGELFARVERLEGQLGLELRPPGAMTTRLGEAEGHGEPPSREAKGVEEPELVDLRAHVRGLQQLLERLQVAVGVESGHEIPCLTVSPPRTTPMVELSRVRAFLSECTEPLKNDKKSTRTSASRGVTAAELAAAYVNWAERRGIPSLGVQSFTHQLARLSTPRRLYRRRFYYALEVRPAAPVE